MVGDGPGIDQAITTLVAARHCERVRKSAAMHGNGEQGSAQRTRIVASCILISMAR